MGWEQPIRQGGAGGLHLLDLLLDQPNGPQVQEKVDQNGQGEEKSEYLADSAAPSGQEGGQTVRACRPASHKIQDLVEHIEAHEQQEHDRQAAHRKAVGQAEGVGVGVGLQCPWIVGEKQQEGGVKQVNKIHVLPAGVGIQLQLFRRGALVFRRGDQAVPAGDLRLLFLELRKEKMGNRTEKFSQQCVPAGLPLVDQSPGGHVFQPGLCPADVQDVHRGPFCDEGFLFRFHIALLSTLFRSLA